MNVPAWSASCHAMRDCGCCGARGALVCVEPHDHEGIHAFLCRNCGRGRPCWS